MVINLVCVYVFYFHFGSRLITLLIESGTGAVVVFFLKGKSLKLKLLSAYLGMYMKFGFY